MEYFQGVVTDYLRANRSIFVNTEYLIQLDPGNEYKKGRHWYCDAVAMNHESHVIQLCEVTYSKTLYSLVERFRAWSLHWDELVKAIHRDSHLGEPWKIEPRAFIPTEMIETFQTKSKELLSNNSPTNMPHPIITPLEEILPWKYRSWNGEHYQ